MKSYKVRAHITSNEVTESGGQPRERVTFTPVHDPNKLGPADSLTITVDDKHSLGIFKGATEADIEITPVGLPKEDKHK